MAVTILGPFHALDLTTCPYCGDLIPPGEEVVILQEPYPDFARMLYDTMHLGCFQTFTATPESHDAP